MIRRIISAVFLFCIITLSTFSVDAADYWVGSNYGEQVYVRDETIRWSYRGARCDALVLYVNNHNGRVRSIKTAYFIGTDDGNWYFSDENNTKSSLVLGIHKNILAFLMNYR